MCRWAHIIMSAPIFPAESWAGIVETIAPSVCGFEVFSGVVNLLGFVGIVTDCSLNNPTTERAAPVTKFLNLAVFTE